MSSILIDAGHGGSDPGATYKGREESNDTLRLANRIKYHLNRHNIHTDMTRDTDTFVSLEQRVAIEHSGKYDYFVSIHRNAFHPESAHGVETYSLSTTGKGRELSERVQGRLKNYFYDRGCKTAIYYVLEYTNCSAILIEVGFIDNTQDNNVFDAKFENIAIDIAKSIVEQLGLTYKSEPTIPAPATGEIIYEVIRDGKQVGAYKMIGNILDEVNRNIQGGANEVIIKRVVK